MKQLFNIRTLLKGKLLGLKFCAYTTIMWLTQLDTTYLRYGQYVDMAIILLPIGMIFWAIKAEMKHYPVNVWQGIVIAIFVGSIAYLIYDPFLYAYHHLINPDWYDSVLQLEAQQMRLALVPEAQIEAKLVLLRQSSVAQAGLYRLSTFIPSAIIVPLLSALLSLIFIRNPKTNNQ